jgi:hypothetical protein
MIEAQFRTKYFDFSYDTINQLIKKGIDDALDKVFEAEKKKHNNSVHDACSELEFIDDVEAQNTNADQYFIEAAENVKRINKCKT